MATATPRRRRADTIANRFTYCTTAAQHHVDTNYWPSAYGQFPGGMGGDDGYDWYYTRPTMSANNPCSNEGGFEGTLTHAAYAIIGVYSGVQHGQNQDPAPRDFDVSGNRQAMYPSDRVLNDGTNGGGSITICGVSTSCSNCGFIISDSVGETAHRYMIYYRMYLTPGFH